MQRDRLRDFEVARELRSVVLRSGGTGCILLCVREGGVDRWIGEKAYMALEEAANQRGYGNLVQAVWAGLLPDLISDAIEALEANPLEPVEIEVAC